MRLMYFLFFMIAGIQTIWAQDTLAIAEKPVIKDASYAGGGIEDLYYYVNTNFNYNNVKKEDIPASAQKKPYFIFYVVFAVRGDGKAFGFSPKEIAAENTFYKEAVRVIASTRWNIGSENGIYRKQFLVLPIKASLSDF